MVYISDKGWWNAEINLVKQLLSESDVVINKINKDIQQQLYDEYPKTLVQERLEIEKNSSC